MYIDYNDFVECVVDDITSERARTVVNTCDSRTMRYAEIELKHTFMTDIHNRFNLSVKMLDTASNRFKELNCELVEMIEHELRALNHEIFAVN